MTLALIIIGSFVLIFGFVVFFGAPYVPSQRRYVRRAFQHLYPLGKNDTLVDIGAGDGIVLREARRFGARVIGYEINPILYVIARLLSGRDAGATIHLQNFWTTRLPSETTVVYAFSVNRDARRLMKRLQTEANRLHRRLALVSLGNPLPGRTADKVYDAYHLYYFSPESVQA
jgi:hypothetical protein